MELPNNAFLVQQVVLQDILMMVLEKNAFLRLLTAYPVILTMVQVLNALQTLLVADLISGILATALLMESMLPASQQHLPVFQVISVMDIQPHQTLFVSLQPQTAQVVILVVVQCRGQELLAYHQRKVATLIILMIAQDLNVSVIQQTVHQDSLETAHRQA